MKKPFIIAEMSGNHLGQLDLAKQIVKAAHDCGADAIKFQTFTPEQMVGPLDYVIESGPWKGDKLIDLYRKTHTPREWHSELFQMARDIGLTPLSTPFHTDDVDFLETLDCPIYKISSFEITDLELIKYAALTGKQVIISTGMATEEEIDQARITSYIYGNKYPILLKCTSSYPADTSDANLATMVSWAEQGKVGISDHTLGIGVAVAAIALGAEVIEKHLTIDRRLGGPDSSFSLEPNEFKELVTECNRAFNAIGKIQYFCKNEEPNKLLRRSLWFSSDLESGEILKKEHLKIARPFNGTSPGDQNKFIGKRINQSVKAGEAVHGGLVENNQ